MIPATRSRRIRHLVDAVFLIVLSSAALVAGARAGLPPRDAAQGVAVIFAPWTAASETLTRAVGNGGRFVRYGAFPFIAIVASDDRAYAQRLLDAGAWLVLDPQSLAACLAALPLPVKD